MSKKLSLIIFYGVFIGSGIEKEKAKKLAYGFNEIFNKIKKS